MEVGAKGTKADAPPKMRVARARLESCMMATFTLLSPRNTNNKELEIILSRLLEIVEVEFATPPIRGL